MAINLQRLGTGVGVGVVDSILEDQDAKANRTEAFKRWTNIARLLGVLGGHGVGMVWPRYGAIGEDIANAYTPLLTKTVYAMVVRGAKSKSGNFAFTPQERGAYTSDWAPSSPPIGGATYRRS